MPLRSKQKSKNMFGRIKFILAVFSGILLVSCTNSNQVDRSGPNNFDNTDTKDKESTVKLTPALPIKLDSSAYIIFPIHESKESGRISKTSYKSRSGYENYIDNIIFQHIENEKTHLLTTDKIKIVSYEQLYNSKREAEKIMVYQIIDAFSENDEDLTLTSLYLGTNDGKLFKKISKPNHHVNSWKYISETKKIYFKTIEDIDKNNKLNSSDKHYIYSVSMGDFKMEQLLNKEIQILNN